MDPVKILKRSWYILWNYRVLWVFGLILAIATGSAGGSSNNNSGYSSDSSEQQFEMSFPQDWEDWNKARDYVVQEAKKLFQEGLDAAGITQEDLTALIGIGIAFLLVLVITGIILTIAYYVSETAVIRMVDEYEATDTKMTLKEGFRIGWSRTSWRLFLINLIVHLPIFVLITVLLLIGFFVYTVVSGRSEPFAIAAGTVGLIGAAVTVIFLMITLYIILRLLRHFFWRVCVLEDVGVRESLKRGYQLVRENWQNVGLMWLIMIGLGIAWLVTYSIVIILVLPVVLITGILGAVVAIIPGSLLAGLFSAFLSGYLPWIAAGIFVLPLFFLLAFSPWALLTAWEKIYTSTVWTLTYREVKALPAQIADDGTGPVGD